MKRPNYLNYNNCIFTRHNEKREGRRRERERGGVQLRNPGIKWGVSKVLVTVLSACGENWDMSREQSWREWKSGVDTTCRVDTFFFFHRPKDVRESVLERLLWGRICVAIGVGISRGVSWNCWTRRARILLVAYLDPGILLIRSDGKICSGPWLDCECLRFGLGGVWAGRKIRNFLIVDCYGSYFMVLWFIYSYAMCRSLKV